MQDLADGKTDSAFKAVMPTYHYICECGNNFEVVESIKSPRQKHCSLCGKDTLETVMYGGIHASVDPGCTTLGHLAEKNSKKMGKYQLSEIAEKNPAYTSFCISNYKKLEDFRSGEIEYKQEKDALLEWKELSLEGLNEQDMKIASWLNKNIRKPRVIRQEQLYIHGPKKMGKSTFLDNLSKYLMVYLVPTEEEFYDHYA